MTLSPRFSPAAPPRRTPVPRLLACAALFLAAWTPAAAQTPPAPPHVDVVALRVAFQPDTTRFTTGDGTFETAPWGALRPSVDPLPHDADYFRAHLAFLEDYVETVSDGRTRVTTHLVPEVVQVSGEMSAYAPTGFDADGPAERAKLAALVEEAWTRASAEATFDAAGLDPSTTVFLLFHAGVGRDVELTGTTLDRTPGDLPSLFFDEAALGALVGRPIRFKGLPVRHTAVLPRSETRRGTDVISEEPFLLELSTNGLIAASFFNALGVPDLFDTATGESAIGPYGLMDPLGFFAYGGLFPPEPSAWTRVALGWAEPIDLGGGEAREVTLDAAGLAGGASIARVRVSGSEMFLVENRHRDPGGDGLVLRVWRDGEVVEQRVEDGDETFNNAVQSGFVGGVVVGVDDYDWALPGGLDENGGRLLGGALVWHVDEGRVAAGWPANAVNADPERRGIDLEEADGAQDLGYPGVAFGPQAERGSPFDFFYEGNPVAVETAGGRIVRLYENRFGPATTPSSATNAGGPSFVVLDAFSPPGPTMTFTYRRAEHPSVAPLPVPPAPLPGAPDAILAGPGDSVLVYVPPAGEADGAVYAVRGEAVGVLSASAVAVPVWLGGGSVAVLEREAGGRLSLQWYDDGAPSRRGSLPAALGGAGVRSQLARAGDEVVVLLDDAGTAVLVRVRPGGGAGEEAVTAQRIEAVGAAAGLAVLPDGRILVGGDRGARAADESGAAWSFPALPGGGRGGYAFGVDAGGTVGAVGEDGALRWLLPDGTTRSVPIAGAGGAEPIQPILADLDGDARLDALVAAGRRLVAVAQSGAVVRGFPVELPSPAAGAPLVAAWEGGPVVVVPTQDGAVRAVPIGGAEAVESFPLPTDASERNIPLLQNKNLIVVSGRGGVSAWRLAAAGETVWGARYAGPGNPNAVAVGTTTPPPAASSLIDVRETYNWPNPIRDGRTHLRCTTSRDATVEVTIVDLAGSVLERLTMTTRAGLPEEVEWATDLPSGVYYARLRATGTDGTTESHVVKMAVIR